MKLTKYTIYFKGGNIVIYALNYNQAKILAQAEAIKKGWDYEVCTYSVEETEEIKPTLREFLMTQTLPEELCVIRESGYIVATAWIDHEDLFCNYLNAKLGDMTVKSDKWDYLPIVDADGYTKTPRCHYIDV